MKNVTGQVAQGADFFDRELEQTQYWSDLETDNLLLLAPRRVGKTSVMRRMQETSDEHGYSVVFVDVSDAGDEFAFTRRLYQAVLETDRGTGLWNRLKASWLADTVRRVKKVGGGGFSVEFDLGEVKDWSRLRASMVAG
jgi:AAA+ ATPase superfamily predicted ATPase